MNPPSASGQPFTRNRLRSRPSFVKPRDTWLDVLFLEHFAIPITRICAAVRVSPTFVTVVSVVLRVAAAVAFVESELRLGGILYIVGLLLDGVDGKLARLTAKASAFGGMFDFSADFGTFVLLVISIGEGIVAPIGLILACASLGTASAFATALSPPPAAPVGRGRWDAFTERHHLNALPGVLEVHFLLFGVAPLISAGVVQIFLVVGAIYFAAAWVLKLRGAGRPV